MGEIDYYVSALWEKSINMSVHYGRNRLLCQCIMGEMDYYVISALWEKSIIMSVHSGRNGLLSKYHIFQFLYKVNFCDPIKVHIIFFSTFLMGSIDLNYNICILLFQLFTIIAFLA